MAAARRYRTGHVDWQEFQMRTQILQSILALALCHAAAMSAAMGAGELAGHKFLITSVPTGDIALVKRR
jgi:hypothetical protein